MAVAAVVCLLDLATVAQKHNVTVHAFADDTQMYLHCSRDDTTSAADHLERCIADVCQWMSANRLKLNYGQDRVAMGRNEAQSVSTWPFSCVASWS